LRSAPPPPSVAKASAAATSTAHSGSSGAIACQITALPANLLPGIGLPVGKRVTARRTPQTCSQSPGPDTALRRDVQVCVAIDRYFRR